MKIMTVGIDLARNAKRARLELNFARPNSKFFLA